MKRFFSIGLLLVIAMLMTTGGLADQKIDRDDNCEVCLKTSADGSLTVNWSAETVDAISQRDESLAYHDGSFEGQLGTEVFTGALGVRFSVDAPILLTGFTLYTQEDASMTGGVVSIYLDPAATLSGPPSQPLGPGDGTAVWESEPTNFSSSDGSLQQFDMTFPEISITSGDYYIVVWENGSGFGGISNDLQLNHTDRNYVSLGSWATLSDATGGDPLLTGNLGITASFLYQDIAGSYMTISPMNIDFGTLQIDDGAVSQNVTIANLGNEDFSISSIGVTGADFSTSLAAPITVTAGTSAIMDVTLTPTAPGATEGTFTVVSDADNMTEAVVTASAMVYDGFPDYMVWNPSLSISGQAFLEGLQDLGYTAVATTDLFMFGNPVDAGYSAVFVTLGMFSDNFELIEGSPEVTALIDYVIAGNPIYMEGGDTWAYDDPTSLHGFFGIDGFADGSDDLFIVDGETQLDGMDYTYNGDRSFVDHISPLSIDATILHSNPADGIACGIGNMSPGINTIGNAFEFGGLSDSVSTVSALLSAYLDFLNTPFTDNWAPTISNVTELPYTQDTVGPYTIEADIADNVGVDIAILFYNIDGGSFSTASMADMGDGVYAADIPGQAVGSTIGYYILAMDEEGNEGYSPADAPGDLYYFNVLLNLPPLNLRTASGLDGKIELSWITPGANPGEAMFEGFEDGIPVDWTVDGIAGDQVADGWRAYSLTTAPEGGQVARVGDGAVSEYIDEWLITNPVMIGSLNSTLSFYHYGSLTSYDNAPNFLKISSDDGSTWDELLVWDLDAAGESTLPDAWTLVSVDLSAYQGAEVQLAWQYTSTWGEFWHLDAVELSTPARVAMMDVVLDIEVEQINSKNNYTETVNPVIDAHSVSGFTHIPSRERELTAYEIVRDGSSLATMGTDVLDYTDLAVFNGTEYCYVVIAQYPDGDAQTSPVCASPVNHNPEPVVGLQGVVDDMTVTLDWEDNTDYDFDHYNIYRDGNLIGGASVSNATDVLTIGGIYEYAITAVDAEDAESEMSDDVTMLVGNLPPMRLTAESGLDGTVRLEWDEPGQLGPGLLDCADELIEALPFSAVGSNAGMGDDFDVNSLDGEDYAYQLWMPEDGVIDITLCSDVTDYDTKLEIFNSDCFTTTTFYDDDGPFGSCPESPAPYAPSELIGISLAEGIYFIVVDGFDVAVGNYEITVSASAARNTFVAEDPSIELAKIAATGIEVQTWEMSSAPARTINLREQLGFQVYRDGTATGSQLAVDARSFIDQYIPNGVEYCYIVEAVYDDGNSASNEACATPLNWNPLAPQNLTFTINDHDIALLWDANSDYDLASYNVYRDEVLVINTTDTTFSENLPISNIYHYYITAVDAEDGESTPSNVAILPVGNLPPASAVAESGLDGGVQLSWLPPGTMGGDGLYQDFESGIFPPADWSQLQGNPVNTWQLYDDNAYEGLLSAGVWWEEFEHQDEWLYTPEITIGANDMLTFWSYAQQGSEHGDHYYVKVSTDGGVSWDIVLDMSTLPVFDNIDNSNYNDWQVPYSVDLSEYLGESVQIAFHGIDVDDEADPNYPGLWWVWLLDGITVGPEGGAPTFAANTGLWGTHPEHVSRELSTQSFQFRDITEFEPVLIHSPVREMRSQIGEYRIYRSLTSPVLIDEASLLVTLDTLALEYWDFEPLTNGTDYFYVIAANYPEDTELSLSPELIGTPMNHAPSAPLGLVGVGDENSNVVLDWDDNTEYDLVSYNVYRDDVFVTNLAVSNFTEVATAPGVYEYMVTAVDAEDAESELSEAVNVPTGPLPPERLTAESGLDGQVLLEWAAPGDMMPALLPCGDVMIESLPFSATGTNSGFGNNFDVSGGGGEDIAYQLWMPSDGIIDVTLCSDQTSFDTKLEIFNADCNTSTGFYNDDDPACSFSTLSSTIEGAFLPEGVYLIVVDGYSGAVGNFGIEVTESDMARDIFTYDEDYELEKLIASGVNPDDINLSGAEIRVPQSVNDDSAERSFDGFQVYRDGIAVSEVLPIDTYSYVDGWNVDEDLSNGTEYCYTVASVYTAAVTQSNEACATPLNHQPSVPQNVTAEVNDLTNEVTLDWDDATDYDLTGYNVYVNDEFQVYSEASLFAEILDDGTYYFQIKSVDAGGLESSPSNRLLVIVGEAPPENLVANGNFDDHIALSWAPPGGGGTASEFRYDDDVMVGQLGFTDAPANGIMGAAHPVNASLSSVSWFITSEGGPHSEVKVLIFGLDAAGVPDVDQVLHISGMIPNTDDTWNDYQLPESVTSASGFFIGLNTPGQFTALGTDDGIGAPWDFMMGTQWAIADYTAGNIGWLDIGTVEGFAVNFMIRGYGQSFEPLAVNYNPVDYRRDKLEYLALEHGSFAAVDVTRPEQLDINREITEYNIYRDGTVIATTSENNYNDIVQEDISYFYEITATYANNETSAPTNMVEARANMAPGPMTSFQMNMPSIWQADFGWVDPVVNMDNSPCGDFEGILVKKDGIEYDFIDPIEWEFNDFASTPGDVVYEFIPFDEVPNYGAAIMVTVPYGPQPLGWDFNSGELPPEWTQSNPIVPWTVGTATEISSDFWTIPETGSPIAAINDDFAGDGMDGNNTLITNSFDFASSGDVTLTFDNFFDGSYGSLASVEYRIGATGNWQVLENVQPSDVWTVVSIDLGLLNGIDNVYLGFHHDDATAWASGWAIDNVVLHGFNTIMMGDLNGDGVLNIQDITRLIEIVTQTGLEVTPDEIGLLDLNGDGAYNVLDVVILIEAVLNSPGLAKEAPIVENISASVAPQTLNANMEWQNIPVTVDYDGSIAGFQADLLFDPSVVELGLPTLGLGNENVAVFTSLNGNMLRVLAIDLSGGQIDLSSGLLMDVPVQVIDENASGATDFSVEGLVLSGPGGIEIECECLVSIIDIGLPAPTEFSLKQNYPNPFNPTTNIRYDIAGAGDVQLVIYNMLGQHVRTLVSGPQNVGYYEVVWNGLNDAGQPVATGVYIYHIRAGNYSKTHKMAFIK